jgi:Transposase DNA-binding/Transposase Tn5 dimerisation domain
MDAWIAEELKTVDLGDVRLDRRFEMVLERLAARPSVSIPAACKGLAETQAAYRFFDNDRVEAEKILRPHRQATLERIRQQSIVLIVQDTTELEMTRPHEKVGGPLSWETQIGFLDHVLLALTPERVPLGIVDAEIWARDPEDFHKRRQKGQKPIEEKESYRWLQGYRQACVIAEAAPATTVICVSDSEGDIFECFAEAEVETATPTAQGAARKADWIVRAGQDRRLASSDASLLTEIAKAPVLHTFEVQVSKRRAACGDGKKQKRRQEREARVATCTLRVGRVVLKAPWRKGRQLGDQEVNAVLVREENPPPGEEPIEWLLLTSLPVDELEQAQKVVEYYCCRWEIEIYFRVLKSGCGVEELQLETQERFKACLAVYMIVAWRVLFVLMMGRKCPDLPCDAVLSDDEWQSVYWIVKQQSPPRKPPTLERMVELIASLGGYLGRKHDGPPGPQTLWIGIQRMRDYALAWQTFGPARSRLKRCVER